MTADQIIDRVIRYLLEWWQSRNEIRVGRLSVRRPR